MSAPLLVRGLFSSPRLKKISPAPLKKRRRSRSMWNSKGRAFPILRNRVLPAGSGFPRMMMDLTRNDAETAAGPQRPCRR